MGNARVIALMALFLGLSAGLLSAQTVTTFEGIDASQLSNPEYMVNASGAVGTKQFVEYTNVEFQAYDKVTNVPVWAAPQSVVSLWKNNGITACNDIVNDGMIIFDRLALRWVVAGHTSTQNNYNYCVAVSNTDNLASGSLAWYTYVFPLDSYLGTNAEGQTYFPDWPKIATWPNGYYVSIDLNDLSLNFREVGVLVCALDRTDMLVNGTANAPICLGQMSSPDTSVYLEHSLIPADVEGTNPPPNGRDEFLTSIENPVLGGGAVTSSSFNLWDFHVDWANPSASTLTQSSIPEAPYQPGCYTVGQPVNTICVPEPSSASTGQLIDSVGDRFMPSMSYRNFGAYESFVVSHTVQAASGKNQQTAIRWYELRDNGSGKPSLYQDGNISPDNTTYRFMPSIAEDANGNAAAGYNISSSLTHPGMNAAYFSLTNPDEPTEITLYDGAGDEENTWHMGSYSSMTVDPEDGCTFWYVAQYFPANQTGSPAWGSRISNFALPGCGEPSVFPTSVGFAGEGVGITSAAQTVTLLNSQTTALSISSINFTGADSGDFSQQNSCGSSLPAGEACTINVTFTAGALGTRTATLNINDNGENSPQTVSLSGSGIVPVTLSVSSISFGGVTIGGKKVSKPVTLTNNQSTALTNIKITITGSSAYSQVNTCGTSIAANGTCTITVTFAPTTKGAQTGTVNIADSASNSPQTIGLTGSGLAAVSLNPASLNFGTVTVGKTSAVKTVSVTNYEKSTVTFTSVQITGTNSSDFAQTDNCTSLASGAQCSSNVTFTPLAKGSRTATLTLTDTATNSPQMAALSGTGQ